MKIASILSVVSFGFISIQALEALDKAQSGEVAKDLDFVMSNPELTPEIKANPCFKSALEYAMQNSKTSISKEQEAKAKVAMARKLKILQANKSDPRKALKEHALATDEDCKEMAEIASACTLTHCRALGQAMAKVYDQYDDQRIRQTYDFSVAIYTKGTEENISNTSLTDNVWVPELERQGQKVNPEELKMLRGLEINQNQVEAGKKTKAQGYIDAVDIMAKTIGKKLTDAEKKALEESRVAAQAFAKGEIDEAEFQVRSIEAHAKAAGEKISPQERKELLEEIRRSLVQTTDSAKE